MRKTREETISDEKKDGADTKTLPSARGNRVFYRHHSEKEDWKKKQKENRQTETFGIFLRKASNYRPHPRNAFCGIDRDAVYRAQ